MGFGLRLRKPKHLGLRNPELLGEFGEAVQECGGGGARTARKYWRALSWTRSPQGPRPRSRGPSRASGVLGAADRLSALRGGPVWVGSRREATPFPQGPPPLLWVHRRPQGPNGALQSRATKDLRWNRQPPPTVRFVFPNGQIRDSLTGGTANCDIVFRHLY